MGFWPAPTSPCQASARQARCYPEGVHRLMRACLFGLAAAAGFAQAPPLLGILSQEMDRNFLVLRERVDPAPYFLAYEVTEREAYLVSATLGSLQSSDTSRTRFLDVTLRVGSPKLDNYHRLPGNVLRFSTSGVLPLDDKAEAIQQRLWLETDRAYRDASERLLDKGFLVQKSYSFFCT